MDRFRVLIINEEKNWGGAEVYTLNLSQTLQKRGLYTVIVVNSNSKIKEKLKVSIPVEEVPMRNELDLEAILKIKSLISKHKINIVHTHTQRDHVLASFAAKSLAVKNIFRSQHIHYPNGCSMLAKMAYNKLTTNIFCVSNSIKNNLLNSLIKKELLQVIYTGIDSEEFEPYLNDRNFRLREGISDDTIAIGCVGNLFPTKGQDYLIKAVKIVSLKYPNLLLYLAGHGNQRPILEKLAKDLEISKKVKFLGFRDDVPPIVSSMDIMAVPSVWEEPAGLSNIEAMFMRKPLVASRVGGIPELVNDGKTGLLVRPKDENELAQGLIKIIENPEFGKTMGENGHLRVKQNFTHEKMTDRVIQAYMGFQQEPLNNDN